MDRDNERGWYFRALGAALLGGLAIFVSSLVFLHIGFNMGKPRLDPESEKALYLKKQQRLREIIG